MTLKQALDALKKAGTAQNVKVYGRHGVRGEMYGVSFADLKRLKKTIGTDHELAGRLWATGNHDARVLATMIAEPAAMTNRDLNAWVRELDNYVLCDAFSAMTARTSRGLGRYTAWRDRKNEYVAAAAFNVLAAAAVHNEGAEIDDAFAREQIDLIAREIHDRPNRTRHSMNQALICLGAVNPDLATYAKAAAKRIGKIEVDHGETSCTTPDATAYIDKTRAHREQKAVKAVRKKAVRRKTTTSRKSGG